MKKSMLGIIFFYLLIAVTIYFYNSDKDKKRLTDPDYYIDSKTGVVWENKLINSYSKDWISAKHHCSSLKFGELTEWTLPTKNELDNGYSINSELKERSSWLHWSSTEVEDSKDLVYCMNFDGGMLMKCKKNKKAYVKCVTHVDIEKIRDK